MFGLIFVVLAIAAMFSIAAVRDKENKRRKNRYEEMLKHPTDYDTLTYINDKGYMTLTENGHPCVWENGRFLKDLKTGFYVYDKYAAEDWVYIKLYKARLLHGVGNAYNVWFKPGSNKYVNLIHSGEVYPTTYCGKYGSKRTGYIENFVSNRLLMPGLNYNYILQNYEDEEKEKYRKESKEELIRQNNIIIENENKYSYLSKDEKVKLNKKFNFIAGAIDYNCDRDDNLYDIDTYEGLFEGDDIYE